MKNANHLNALVVHAHSKIVRMRHVEVVDVHLDPLQVHEHHAMVADANFTIIKTLLRKDTAAVKAVSTMIVHTRILLTDTFLISETIYKNSLRQNLYMLIR